MILFYRDEAQQRQWKNNCHVSSQSARYQYFSAGTGVGGHADGHERIRRLTEQSRVDPFYLQRKRSPFSHISIHTSPIIPVTAAVAAYPQSELCDNSSALRNGTLKQPWVKRWREGGDLLWERKRGGGGGRERLRY